MVFRWRTASCVKLHETTSGDALASSWGHCMDSPFCMKVYMPLFDIAITLFSRKSKGQGYSRGCLDSKTAAVGGFLVSLQGARQRVFGLLRNFCRALAGDSLLLFHCVSLPFKGQRPAPPLSVCLGN